MPRRRMQNAKSALQGVEKMLANGPHDAIFGCARSHKAYVSGARDNRGCQSSGKCSKRTRDKSRVLCSQICPLANCRNGSIAGSLGHVLGLRIIHKKLLSQLHAPESPAKEAQSALPPHANSMQGSLD
jgi:hypothetical protein